MYYHTYDNTETLEEAALQKLLQWISNLRCIPDRKAQDFVNIQRQNGQICLTMSGLFNHRSAFVIDILKRIAVIMPGSYGLLYIHNEEDDKGEIDYSNEFVVWKLARGNLTLEKDPFLSPCIEDFFNPSRVDM
ncbi:Imm7 family immunity protein [Leptospira noguchii]|uniref:Imm7 family immunity protein n=1 Tax=Leptospira noguchii TaxID=28182 RepID=UPI000248A707|nr:Imm7 family immunity protein [Leptospira noguchii]EKR71261.1 hypothetical protein LEP1GSC041_1650 [Leptospira noguchii str. 2006001870]EMS82690.1 hypothetical protein LEP1GSC074_2336 [Leptospira noguchii str. Hook]UOG40947.1 immunity 7 family protein [Leptospira noguchii]